MQLNEHAIVCFSFSLCLCCCFFVSMVRLLVVPFNGMLALDRIRGSAKDMHSWNFLLSNIASISQILSVGLAPNSIYHYFYDLTDYSHE